MRPWIPSGRLDDGTLLLGPLREKPQNSDLALAVEVDGRTWWVEYCCRELTEEQRDKIRTWARAEVEKQAPA